VPRQAQQIPGRYKALDVSGQALAFPSTVFGFRITGVSLAEDLVLLDTGLDFAISDGMTGVCPTPARSATRFGSLGDIGTRPSHVRFTP
jgi:hypothetical protein